MVFCYSKNIPKFGKKDVFLTLREIYGSKLPLRERTYNNLLDWKLCYSRRKILNIKLPRIKQAEKMIKEILKLLTLVRRELNENSFR